jgi:hypothetical protein
MRGLAALMAAALLTGCYFGPQVRDFAFTQGPQGVSVSAESARGAIAGELLAVDQEGLLLLKPAAGASAQRVVLLDYRAIREARCEKMGPRYVLRGGVPDAEKRALLQAVSRFPQGLSAALLRQLLDAHGQAEVEAVRP